MHYDNGRFATALTSIRGFDGAGAMIGSTSGFIAYDRPFHSAGSFRVETPPAGQPRTVTVALEGNGYVPMFRAVSNAVSDGLLEHPLRPLQDTIEVMQLMEKVRRQLPHMPAGQ